MFLCVLYSNKKSNDCNVACHVVLATSLYMDSYGEEYNVQFASQIPVILLHKSKLMPLSFQVASHNESYTITCSARGHVEKADAEGS